MVHSANNKKTRERMVQMVEKELGEETRAPGEILTLYNFV
jgi:hypothetical protein